MTRCVALLLVFLLAPAAGGVTGPPTTVALPAIDGAATTFTQTWTVSGNHVPTSGCSVSDGVGWVVAPIAADGACIQGEHGGGIAASTLTCPAPTHCTLYAETRADPYGAFQIHCYPFGQGARVWPGPGGAAQCIVLTAGAPPPTWNAWWSWVSIGPSSGTPLRAVGVHVHAF